tara:strand:- start:363 stop:536 length:174 start_codon:yes stop_codon:yes gene_type:complete
MTHKSSKIIRANLEKQIIDLQKELEKYKKAYESLKNHLETIDLENFKKQLKNQVRNE